MKTYFQNGTSADIEYSPDYVEKFCVQKMLEPSVEKYIYTGDSIKYELDAELVILYDKLRDLLFEDVDKYYSELDIIPIFVQDAGYDSDCVLDKNTFLKLVNEYKDKVPNLYKHLYLVDIQFLIATIQNLLEGMDYSFTNFFVQISNIEHKNYLTDKTDTVLMLTSQDSRYISSLLESYFTKAYSILDILTKICYEFENKYDSFENYKKTKSANILWGDRKHLSIKDAADTVFIRSDTIKLIESLRNEVVHNGSLEQNPKVFITLENNEIVERFMLLPDFIDGTLVTAKNRKHFFSDGNKANDLLPQIHMNYLKEILSTIKYLNANY
ncbi:MAG: hypothetical protein UGF89_06145 [Acutalibacteraceae bacterium]|nr:hypothetical protein [Acutalibacteraceae bacterium]